MESSRRSVIIGLSTKQSPGGTTPTEDAPTEIKLPPLVPFKPKPAAAADSGAASTTKVEVVIPPVHREDSSPPEVEKTASSPEAAKPAGENPAVQNGLLLAWSDATVKPAEPAPLVMELVNPPATDKTAVAGVRPTATYEVFNFMSPCEKPGYLGCVANFRVRELIGEGGMGYVFLAEDKYLKRPVALKVMKPRVVRKKRCWGWFIDEARATSALQSDRMATIYQIGEHRGGLFLAMELLYGESLEARLKRARLPLEMALWVAQETARGLALVHRVGICHRDIKPPNLWLNVPRNIDLNGAEVLRTYGDRKVWTAFDDHEYTGVKILDFGLARLKEGGRGRQKTGEILGTPWYMAPEQARGEKGSARSDLFSFGVVLYRMLSGQLPFSGDTALEVLTAMISSTPKPVLELNPGIPSALADLTMQLLANRPEHRPEGALEVVERLEGITKTYHQDCEKALATAARSGAKPLSKSSAWRRMFGN
ncbi:MAG TPA: serine/threonine-protein kinase [Gemmataceae bacterium]|nr:serine/threonine-protein kinase [Gemmataceae bacterium]